MNKSFGLNGGYLMLDLTSDNLYIEASNILLNNNKPVIVYDGVNIPYYVTSMKKVNNSIIINDKIKINEDNSIEEISNNSKLYYHKIFLECYEATYSISYVNIKFLLVSNDNTPIDSLAKLMNNFDKCSPQLSLYSPDYNNDYPLTNIFINPNNNNISGFHGDEIIDCINGYDDINVTDTIIE